MAIVVMAEVFQATSMTNENEKGSSSPQPEAKKPYRKRVGRPSMVFTPTVWTEAKVQEIADNIGMGLTGALACAACNPPVSLASFEQAMVRHPHYADMVLVARAKFAQAALRDIRMGAQGWQGAAWILERRHGVEFRREAPVINVTNQNTVNAFAIPENIINDLGTRALKQFGRQPAIEAGSTQEEAGEASSTEAESESDLRDASEEAAEGSDHGFSFGK